jgi:ubiquitin carboxyl-terminal hydrolase 14
LQLKDTELMLKCNIDSTVNHLSEGIKLGLQGDREKTSSTLGRLAVFRGEGRIESLPPYLTVQLVRFFYKTDVQQKAKILRKVAFPMLLDMYDLCSDEMKESLNNPRLALKEIEDDKAGISKKQKTTPDSTASGSEVASIDPKAYVGSLTGRYELIGVLTHKGRSADSGHYVSWTKKEDGQWIQFDDEEMIPRKDEEVLALSGGGDWHMAYLLLYKAQKVPPIDEKDSEKPTDNKTEVMKD